MSHTGRPKKLPSVLKQHRVAVNLSEQQLTKLVAICTKRALTYTEYFRSILAKDNG